MNFFSQKNRILLKELIKTDFKLRYQGSFIGYLWSILKPLMMFTIMYLVFVRFLRFDDGTPHYAVGLLLAMIFWGFFTEATNMGMLSIVSRGDLLRKLNFPKQTIVISSVLGAAINFLINLVVVFVFALINHVPIGFNTLVIIPLFIEVLLMAMGVAFILSALFVKYRDWSYLGSCASSWYVCEPNYLFHHLPSSKKSDVCCKGYDVESNCSDFTGYASFYY